MLESLDARAKRVFDQVIDRTGDDRSSELEHSCAGAPELRLRVEVLLAAAEKDDEFLCDPTLDFENTPPPLATGEQPGARIGPYRLLERLGEGGFGTVFLAEQSEPVRRRVALKIIKAGMDTRQVIARFEAERQALALMDHPNIAKVLEAGATESGRPYFVMELVQGEPVTRYCDRARLTLAQRLELFRSICAAVQHAHQKGIIHRDLKPSNILVAQADNMPLAKVIDFGIAKATAAPLTENTIFTAPHQVIGTPEYMSPEQAAPSGADIDTRSDIYSLGVVLYELLTGTTPFDRRRLAASGFDGMRRILRDEEPLRPSVRLRSLSSSSARDHLPKPSKGEGPQRPNSSIIEIASCRQMEPPALARTLRGDLDWIVLKCIEKERARRYETASALSDDVERYLQHRPVMATPPSAGYQIRKFVRRNRGAVLAGGAVALTLLAAVWVSLAFGLSEARQRRMADLDRQRAQRAEGQAQDRAEELEKVAQFQERQLSGIHAQTMGIRLRADLLEKARAVGNREKLPPHELDARVAGLEQHLAGSDFTGLALETVDENFLQPAAEAIDKQFADEPLVRARLLQTLAATRRELGLLDAASGPQEEALAIRRRMLGDEHADTIRSMMDMGALLHAQGQLVKAETYFREALETGRRVLGQEHFSTLRALSGLGKAVASQGRLSDAELHWREALNSYRRVVGDGHTYTLAAMNNIGSLLHRQGKLSEAEPYYREALEQRNRAQGGEHPETLLSMNNLGYLLMDQGKLPEAEQVLQAALETRRRVLGSEHPDTLSSINNLAMLLYKQGKLDAAEPYLLESLEMSRRVLGNEHTRTLNAIANMGALFKGRGQLAAAEPYAREVLDTSRRVLGDDHPDTLISMNNVAWLLAAQSHFAEAEAYYCDALTRQRQVLGDEHPATLSTISNLSNLLLSQGRATETIALLSAAEPAARQSFKAGNAARLPPFLLALGRACALAGEFTAAETNLREAHALLSQAQGATEEDRTNALTRLVELYDAWHAAAPGEGHDQQAAEWRAELLMRPASPQSAGGVARQAE